MDIQKTLIELIQSHLADAETTQTEIDRLREKHGDDYDVWDEVMDLELGWPYDNTCDASIYAWLLHDHLYNETQQWTYEQLANNTDVGTSGRDGWQYVVEHLIYLGLLSPRDPNNPVC